MAAKPKKELQITITASKAAAKKYTNWQDYNKLLQASAFEVLNSELPGFTEVKLTIVLYTDDELLELNRRLLGHDFYTDILTCELEREGALLEAELYFSLDRASENALRYKVTLRNELARLAIHGILHLAGHEDSDIKAKNQMRQKERFFLRRLQTERSIEY
ncbi:MAG: rRNA maturation RNase YbeY [Bacteroidota bacterium]|nr:rRNA maturation RNase YbeY [Bacteroidota bacterium]MDP4229223.1 rRNA maturation RNase YbeY [Bacteroidota bacterium]MDP4236058.1 rRNA maturation RNase YbeY [Bacteroidota bacterium]